MTNEEREAAAVSRREARVALRERLTRLECERDEALEQLAEIHEKTIDALLDIIDAERKKFARLERERDELAAQLAALREAFHNDGRIVFVGDAEIEVERERRRRALADAAPAAEAYTRRVRAEALESAADRWRREWPNSECAIPESWLRARAADLRGRDDAPQERD